MPDTFPSPNDPVHKRRRLRSVRGRLLAGLAGAASAALPAGAFAQDASRDDVQTVLPDVKVTAERRETSLQRTPISVSAVGGAALIEQGNYSLGSLLEGGAAVAGLHGQPAASSQSFYIRGIGTAAPTYNSAVGLYVDDIYIPRILANATFGLPDVERVEVLRGPQGTLYGQNTTAGAVKVVSALPTDERRIWGSVSFGDYGTFNAQGLYSGAIKPGVANFSVAYQHRQNSGTYENRTLGRDENRIDIDQIRAKLRLRPTVDTDVVLSLDAIQSRSDWIAYSPVNIPDAQPRVSYEDRDIAAKLQGGGSSLHWTTRVNDRLSFRSITGWRAHRAKPAPTYGDALPGDLAGFQINQRQHQFSQEFQLLGKIGSLDYVTGVTLFKERWEIERPTYADRSYTIIQSQTDVSSAGIYGQVRYGFTDKLGATFGLRYNRQKDDYSWQFYQSNANFDQVALTGSQQNLKKDISAWTPKLGIEYQPDPRLFTYASITRGSKAGGYNPVAGSTLVAGQAADPERVTAYEVGVKTTHWNGKAQTNLSLFYNDFTDYIANIRNPIVNGQLLVGQVYVNAGKAKTYGVELESTLRPTRALQWRVAATYLQAHFTQFANPTGAASSDYSRNDLPSAPRLSLRTNVSYQLPLSIPGSIRLTGDLAYESKSFNNVDNTVVFPSHTLVNLGAFYTSPRGQWSAFFLVRNATDRTYPIAYTNQPTLNLLSYVYNQPRMFEIGVRFDL